MAFRGNNYKSKTKKKTSSLYCSYTKKDMKRVGWCINKGINIAVSPDRENGGTDSWMVEIRFNKGQYKRDPESYSYENAMKKLYEYYKYYYGKYKLNTNQNG